MAVHLPLSAEAQAEARMLMLSANNILSPASRPPDRRRPPRTWSSAPTTSPSRSTGATGEGRVFRHLYEVEQAYEEGELDLHAKIEVRDERAAAGDDGRAYERDDRRPALLQRGAARRTSRTSTT